MTLADVPTPALLVDVAAMERNIATMARFFAEGDCRLRPHFKAHKTPEIARRQLAAGSCVGLTCATVGEAEIASAFCDDILIANEIIGADKCARVFALACGAGLNGPRGGPQGSAPHAIAYVCRDFVCERPATAPADFADRLNAL